jgi:hypothetical protein
MFEKITKKLITKTKQTVKKEMTTSIENQLPKILGIITIGIAIISFMEGTNSKTVEEGNSHTIINLRDIYIYYNEK